MSTHIPGFHFSHFLHNFLLAKLATSSIRVNPSNAKSTFIQRTRTQLKIFENHFSHFSAFLNNFVLAELSTSSIRVNSFISWAYKWSDVFGNRKQNINAHCSQKQVDDLYLIFYLTSLSTIFYPKVHYYLVNCPSIYPTLGMIEGVKRAISP